MGLHSLSYNYNKEKIQMSLGFLKDFRKTMDKMATVTTNFSPPTYWFGTGNYALNKSLSGSYLRGIPVGRITVLAGESGAGKSFLCGNTIREAQKEGAFILVLDSENAMDETFLADLGVETTPDKLMYVGVVTIQDVTSVLSEFITGYEKEYGRDNLEAPKVMIVVDSLDMLLTDSESEKFNKGEQTGDMGQRTKLLKHMLRTIVSRISRLQIAFVATHQVYVNQDITNGQGKWIINNAVRYSASQIALISKLNLKEGSEILGIRMRVDTYKSRFAKLGTRVEIEVPYTKGMDPYDGVLDDLVKEGIVEQAGAWYTLKLEGEEPIKFQSKKFGKEIFDKVLARSDKIKAADDLVTSDDMMPESAAVSEV